MFDEQNGKVQFINCWDREKIKQSINYLAEQCWQARVQPVDFEFGSPDVGGDLHQPALLGQGVQVVHLLVANVSKIMRLVPTSSQSSPSSQPWTVERGRFLQISVVGVWGRICMTNVIIYTERVEERISIISHLRMCQTFHLVAAFEMCFQYLETWQRFRFEFYVEKIQHSTFM